jgi:hypothetical protein
MSETAPGTTGLTLQGQLAALRHDHAVLVNIQQALGTPATAGSPATPPGAAVPAPRKKKAATADERSGARKSTVPAGKQTGKKAPAKASTVQSGPTLVDLVREHLAGHREPRSAAEISTELGRQHPERTIKATVVRTTLEGLVARNQAQRTQQGTSVFYTSPDASEPAAQTEESPQQAD